MWIAFDTCCLLTAALFCGQISYLTHQRVAIVHTLRRIDTRSDTVLLREERVSLFLAENKVKLHSVFLFSHSCQMNEVIVTVLYKECSKHCRGSVMFTVIMKELLAGNSSSMKAHLKIVPSKWIS